jgi:hypothetical protein
MPKANRKDTSSTPFQFARQFTAPPFFVGLEDARLKSQLLLGVVRSAGTASAVAPSAKKKPVKKAAAKKKTIGKVKKK